MSVNVPILMYHQVARHAEPGFRKYTVTPAMLRAHVRWLALNGYTSITPEDLYNHRTGGCALPRRPVLITFDDGYRDCVEYAAPVLREHGFTAVFYLVASLMGKTTEWLVAQRGLASPLADWPAARQLVAAGFCCGAHSWSHPHLADINAESCQVELRRSRQALEDGLGCEVRHLAYPYGSYSEMVRAEAAEAGYRTACSVRIGISGPGDDLLALHRVPVNGHETLFDFACRLHTALTCREAARSRLATLLQGPGVKRR